LNVVTFFWKTPGYRAVYTPEHVNTLHWMLRRHLDFDRFICVTNYERGIDSSVEVINDSADFADVRSPMGGQWPSCYRRLRLFRPDAATVFGERFASIDLDCVITGDLRPLFDRDDDFVIWCDPNRRTQYCGSLFMLRAGSRPGVWESFSPTNSPQLTRAAGIMGSDQAWIRYCLPDEPIWTAADGVLSYRVDLQAGRRSLPSEAKVVFFHGILKPWAPQATILPWVRDNWR
jgi:hypothetical protein